MALNLGLGGNQYEQEQTSGPWLPWQTPAKDIYGQAEQLFDPSNVPEYFPGATMAGFDPMQKQANQSVFDLGIGGGSFNPAAMSHFNSVLGGPQVNPYINDIASRIKRDFGETVQPRIDAMFRGAGAGGGSAHALATGRAATGLGDSLAKLYGGAFEADQGRKMQALGMTPGLQQAEFTPFMMARGAGDYMQGQRQREIDADVARHNYTSGGGRADWLTQYANMLLRNMPTYSEGSSSGTNLRSSIGY